MITRIRISIARAIVANKDLLAVWLLLLLAQHYVPVTHPLGRADLAPWMMISLSAAALLRAQPYGAGPHPMLTPRIAYSDEWLQHAAYALCPWVLLSVHDAARDMSGALAGQAFGLALGVVVLLSIAGVHGRTAWNPDRRAPVLAMVLGGGSILGLSAAMGVATRMAEGQPIVRGLALSGLVGLAFLAVGLMAGRVQNHRQRRAAGRKDGSPYRPGLFSAVLATVGPASSLAVVFTILPDLPFNQAYAVSLLVIVWAAVVWPPPGPLMVACVLHEVIPIGGADPIPVDQANPFDVVPSGALRFNPLQTQRTLVMHPWMVPVKSSRIAELDDPIRPLWPTLPPLLTNHILGDCAFEPDPLTKNDQWDVITVRMRGQEDVATVKGGDAKSRRMVILRPFPAPGTSARSRTLTYRWDTDVPEQSVQILDATTEFAELRDGDIIVLSSEGVASAFEVEIGVPIYRTTDAVAFRPPQLEDYVEQ